MSGSRERGTLEVSGLRKRFGDTVALADCSLSVEPGELVGFLGPNGAGKSTTMRAVMRLITVDGGSVDWGGRPFVDDDRRRIGYMPQERGLYARMRVGEQVAYFGRLAGLGAAGADRRAAALIDRIGLADRADSEVQELSVGNQQRVQLAVALVHDPELLVLDEPFAGLDPIAIATLQEIIVERSRAGVGVLFSSHQLDLVQELCRQVVVIHAGRTVARGDVDRLRASSRYRVLDVSWLDDTNAEVAAAWRPPLPDSDVDIVTDPAGRRSFRVPATADSGALIAAAAALGPIASFRLEPPGLGEVFEELVPALPGRADEPGDGEIDTLGANP